MALFLKKKILYSYSFCVGRNVFKRQRFPFAVAVQKYSQRTNTEMVNVVCKDQKEQLCKQLQVFQWLGNETPCFSINGDQVKS